MCGPTTQFKNITITFDVPSESLPNHSLLSFLRCNYPDFCVYHFLDFLYGFTTYVYDPEYIVYFVGFLILHKWSHTVNILPMLAFIIQYYVPDFNPCFFSSHSNVSSLLYYISLNEYITIYLLILLLVEIYVASSVLLSYKQFCSSGSCTYLLVQVCTNTLVYTHLCVREVCFQGIQAFIFRK